MLDKEHNYRNPGAYFSFSVHSLCLDGPSIVTRKKAYALANKNTPTTIYRLEESAYVQWGVCKFSMQWGACKFSMQVSYPIEESSYLPAQLKDNALWKIAELEGKASEDRGSEKRSERDCWERNLETLMALFLANEKGSGYSSLKDCWIQVSDQKRHDLPFCTWAKVKDLKQSSSLRISPHQKEPF